MFRRSSRSDHGRGESAGYMFHGERVSPLHPASHSAGNDPWCSSFGAHPPAEIIVKIGAVGIDVTAIVRKHIGTGASIIDIGGVTAISVSIRGGPQDLWGRAWSACGMEIDEDKIDDAVLVLLLLTLHNERCAWKGFDWATTDRLYQKALIGDPVNKSKSLVPTDEGLRRSEELFRKLFTRQPGFPSP